MAKSSVIFFASALCFLTLLGAAYGVSRFFVEGEVFCDTCRTQFVTRVSEYLEGECFRSLVKFSCRISPRKLGRY